MNRRTYLGVAAAGMIGSIAGCSSTTDGSEYPPYPDSETIDLSGEGVAISEPFELTLDGPTLVDIEHMGSGNFTATLDPADDVEESEESESTTETSTDGSAETNETGDSTETNETDSVETNETDAEPVDGSETDDTPREGPAPASSVATAVGPYDGRSHVSVEAGSYVLNVREADAEWTATVYDLPVYDDGVGVSLPLEREGEQYDVIGPINFGEQTDTEFGFSVTGEGLHRVFLTDREGDESLSVTNFNGDGEDSVSQTVGGVGYIEILSFGSWSFELS